MAIERISPEQARKRVAEEGYTYVDVRSIPEFDAGHPEGAFNVPLMHAGPAGMAPNAEFLAVMERNFPKDAKLVLGCKAGGRSLRAAEMLTAAGFQNVVDQRAGFDGNGAEPGWRPRGLPVSPKAAAGRDYESLKNKA